VSRRFKAALWIAFAISLLIWSFLFIRWRSGAESSHLTQRRKDVCYAMMGQMEQALSMYRIDHDDYPSPLAGGLALLSQPGTRHGAYFEFKPSQKDESGRILDPWGRPFAYDVRPWPRRQLVLYSVGPNGIDEGRKGDDLSHDD